MSYNTDTPNESKCQIPNLAQIYDEYFGERQGIFVEVGAYDGISWSNTFGLLRSGWSGILVEPHPDLASLCKENLSKYNFNFKVIQAAAGREPGSAKLFSGSSLSTVKPEVIDAYDNISYFKGIVDREKTFDVDVVTVDDILANLPHVDLLVVDVEGAELDVIVGARLDRNKPGMVIIEMHEMSEHDALKVNNDEINTIMSNAGYRKIFSDEINTIFVR